MTITLDDIIRSLEALSPEEMEVFLARLMERTGISLPATAAPFHTMGMPPHGTMGAPLYDPAYDVRLLDHGPDKIAVIKLLRELKGLGLKETKDLVESAPVTLFEGLDLGKASDLHQRLVALGATAELR